MNSYLITYQHYDSQDLYQTCIAAKYEDDAIDKLQHSNNGIKVSVIRVSQISYNE